MKSSTTTTVPLFLCGARGMLAGEFLRLAELHPGLELVAASSREPGSAQHRHLPGAVEAVDMDTFQRALAARLDSSERVALVLALPHGESARTWSALRTALGSAAAERVVVVDLAADYRLGAERYRSAYGRVHPDASELARFVYGLPELARGIHLTAMLPLCSPIDGAEARAAYAKRYAGEPFVEVLPGETTPDLRSVVGSNRASIAVEVRGEVLVVLLTLDNLIKGGAGQALQCLDLALGFPETTGLPRSGLGVS